jgi:branched-subunit amino acid transport protein AzlD
LFVGAAFMLVVYCLKEVYVRIGGGGIIGGGIIFLHVFQRDSGE